VSDYVIETHGLTRYFGQKCAVDQLDLAVPRGSVFGFLGRNGSGKTTTIRMLMGLLEPTRGGATVLGYDATRLPPAARGRIGYMAEGHQVYSWMSVRQAMRFQQAAFPKWNGKVFWAVADYFSLDRQAKVRDLSRGQRAGLCLALSLAPEPELLVWDDPALGLDPVARRALLEAMVYVTGKGDRTIFFSSHMLGDVERVADRIAILDMAVLRASCSMETFQAAVRRFVLRFAEAPPQVPAIPGLLEAWRDGHELRITLTRYGAAAEGVLRGLGAEEMREVAVTLEDAFTSFLAQRGEKSMLFADGRRESRLAGGAV